MRIIFAFISILIFFSNAALAEQLKFVQVTDVHLSFSDSSSKGRDLEKSEQVLKSTIESINKLPDINFIVFSGDNIDVAGEESLIEFCKIVKTLNKPYYIGIGNHDVFSSSLNKTDYFKIVKEYNKNQKSAEPEYYFLPNKDFVVIFMDGVIQMIPGAHGCYNENDLEWLDETLTKFKDRKAIIVQHFPLVEPTENKSHKLRRPEEYRNLLTDHKNIVAIVSGHYHCPKVTQQDGIYHISSPALVQAPYEYRVIEIDYDRNSLFQENPQFEIKTEIIPIEPQAPIQTN